MFVGGRLLFVVCWLLVGGGCLLCVVLRCGVRCVVSVVHTLFVCCCGLMCGGYCVSVDMCGLLRFVCC